MRDETHEAERTFRNFIESTDHELVGISVDEFKEDGALISLDIEVDNPDNGSDYRVK